VAWVQRINLLQWPVLGFLRRLCGLLMAGCTPGSRPAAGRDGADDRPAGQRRDRLGVIALFVGVPRCAASMCTKPSWTAPRKASAWPCRSCPYLIAMLAAISLFRSTGCMDYLVGGIGAAVVALG
jgi:hypothetical protein